MSEFRFDDGNALAFVGEHEMEQMAGQAAWAHDHLQRQSAERADGLGWMEWPKSHVAEEFARIKETAGHIRARFDAVVVIGIGGSYLGAKAAMAMLEHGFYNQLPTNKRRGPELYFAGYQLSSSYMTQLLDILEGKDYAVIVVSKSGTTIEPAAAFRLFRVSLEGKWGKEGAKNRIFVVTDPHKGALKALADKEGYATFTIPPDIGGRYSVLTAAGLLPIASVGIDIDEMMKGARQASDDLADRELTRNPAIQYAVMRNLLYRKGMAVELLVSYEPAMLYFAEWWKQLFGESEGKDGKGLFPASAHFTTDLHSLGQYIQSGRRHLFETLLRSRKPSTVVTLPAADDDGDGLEFLAGRTLEDINRKAQMGTMLAHVDGGVPNLIVEIPETTPYWFGYLVYFFEKSCALSGLLLGVNPFDQPGVEAYKSNMYALLGKPGYEERRAGLEQRLDGWKG